MRTFLRSATILPGLATMLYVTAVNVQHLNAQPSAHGHNAKSTFIASRLMGVYHGRGSSVNVLANFDSSAYAYSGNRGGDQLQTAKPDLITNYRWDTATTAWQLSGRSMEWYDAANRDTLLLYENLVAGTWKGYMQFHYGYDAAGNTTYNQQDTFSAMAGVYLPYRKSLSVFNAAGQPLSVESYGWNSISSLPVLQSRYTYTYDAAGNVLVGLIEGLYMGNFVSLARNTCTYDGSGHLLVKLMEDLKTGTSNRITNTYNARGKLIVALDEHYSGGIWQNIQLDSTTYDAAGNLKTHNVYAVITATGSYTPYSRAMNYYNSLNQKIAGTYQGGIGTSAQNSDSNTYAYDAAGNCTQNVVYGWAPGTGTAGVPIYRYGYTFTSFNKKSGELRERFYGPGWQNVYRYAAFYNSRNQMTRTYEQDWLAGAWVFDVGRSETRYYYEDYENGIDLPTGVQAVSVGEISLCPIPAHDAMELTLNLSTQQSFAVTIVDATGRLAMRWNGSGSGRYTHSIATANLTNGVYYLAIRGAECSWVRAFVVAH